MRLTLFNYIWEASLLPQLPNGQPALHISLWGILLLVHMSHPQCGGGGREQIKCIYHRKIKSAQIRQQADSSHQRTNCPWMSLQSQSESWSRKVDVSTFYIANKFPHFLFIVTSHFHVLYQCKTTWGPQKRSWYSQIMWNRFASGQQTEFWSVVMHMISLSNGRPDMKGSNGFYILSPSTVEMTSWQKHFLSPSVHSEALSFSIPLWEWIQPSHYALWCSPLKIQAMYFPFKISILKPL